MVKSQPTRFIIFCCILLCCCHCASSLIVISWISNSFAMFSIPEPMLPIEFTWSWSVHIGTCHMPHINNTMHTMRNECSGVRCGILYCTFVFGCHHTGSFLVAFFVTDINFRDFAFPSLSLSCSLAISIPNQFILKVQSIK